MTDEPSNFLARLKQHHLYGVVVVYAVVVGFLIQLVSRAFPYFGWATAVPAVIIVLLLGFPVVVLLAWLFIKPRDPAKSNPWQRRHWKLSAAFTGVVIVLVVVSGFYGLRFSARNAELLAEANSNASSVALSPAAPASTTVIPAKSIAVLPFVNLSGDPNQKYFSDGITEEILNALAQIPDLKVAGRTSAFQFNSQGGDLRKIGATLGVANVLEGSVQKAGAEVRISVRLVNTRSGYELWSETYDRKLTNIFVIEDEISSAIAGKLRVQFAGGAGQALVAQGTIDPRAHDLYLRGLSQFAARGPGVRDAVATFERAVAIAPQYAQAWGRLAEAEAQLPFYEPYTPKDALSKALSSAQRALSLDPNTASAYVALGVVHSLRWQWAQADMDFHHALALAPNDAETVNQHAQFLFTVGQLEPALDEINRALKLDPLSAVIGVIRGAILTALHRFDEAQAQLETTLKLHPDSVYTHLRAMFLAIELHHFEKAEAEMRVAAKLAGNDPDATALLVRGIADPGQRTAAVRVLATSPFQVYFHNDPIVNAMFLIWLGERDRALDTLAGNRLNQSSIQTKLLWDPAFDPVRNDPRFKAVLKKMGLPYQRAETGDAG
ncbi:MAG TPA: tetratricopeptide repeat protein [Gammaproteobacteria bacterium]|nr:tetratricopeptide repeat protein [Gammaproteobacteria bacterium]